MVDFSKFAETEDSETETSIEESKPTKTVKEMLTNQTTDTTTFKKSVVKTAKKDIKSQSKLNTIKKILDNTKITQDDLWFFVRYLTREQISTIRISKKNLEPIFKNFINKKLNGSE